MKKSNVAPAATRRRIERGRISGDNDIIEQIANALYSPTLPLRLESAEATLESLRNSGLNIVRRSVPGASVTQDKSQAIAAGSFADLTLRLKTLLATCNGKALRLTVLQFQLLAFLIAKSGHDGNVVEPRAIFAAIWKIRSGSTSRLKTQLSTIRGELRRVRSGVTIDSVRGVGYRLGVRA